MKPDRVSEADPEACGKVIVLNGFPGTGKLTMATKMKSYFPEDAVRNTSMLNLGYDTDILETRVTGKERREGSKNKLTDASILRQIMETDKLLNPRPSGFGPMRLIAESMDASGTVEESARQILHILLCRY
ncbi:hypothetical protein ACQKWADRAFT_279050 [Trichoderma austrokoningii]